MLVLIQHWDKVMLPLSGGALWFSWWVSDDHMINPFPGISVVFHFVKKSLRMHHWRILGNVDGIMTLCTIFSWIFARRRPHKFAANYVKIDLSLKMLWTANNQQVNSKWLKKKIREWKEKNIPPSLCLPAEPHGCCDWWESITESWLWGSEI